MPSRKPFQNRLNVSFVILRSVAPACQKSSSLALPISLLSFESMNRSYKPNAIDSAANAPSPSGNSRSLVITATTHLLNKSCDFIKPSDCPNSKAQRQSPDAERGLQNQ